MLDRTRVLRLMVLAAVLAVVGVTACSSDHDTADRWSLLPHSMGCTRVVPLDSSDADSNPVVRLGGFPDQIRVEQVSLAHRSGNRVELAVTFLRALPPIAERAKVPGAFDFSVLLHSNGTALSIDSPSMSGAWSAEGFEHSGRSDVAASVSGRVLTLSVDLTDYAELFGAGAFKPDKVSVLTAGTEVNPSSPTGTTQLLYNGQDCFWSASVDSSVGTSKGPEASQSGTVAPPETSANSDMRHRLAGMIVFLDPGLSGSNDASMYRQVPTGRGGTKDCQATGTSTDDGFPEHTFNWDTTLRVRAALTRLGVRTALTRGDDTSVGPCVDARAAMANAVNPNAIVSIHADSGPVNGRGFHVLYSSPPLNDAQAGPSVQFAEVMRDQFTASGIPPATYIGSGGLDGRSDIAGLNLAQYPSILVECGNMKNAVDSALMKSPEGRQRYADAIVRGIASYLSTQLAARGPK